MATGVNVSCVEDALHFIGGPLKVFPVGIHNLIFRACAHRAIHEDTRHHIQQTHQAEANVENKEHEVHIPVIQFANHITVVHPIVTTEDGTKEAHARFVHAAEIKFHSHGLVHFDGIVQVQGFEKGGCSIAKDYAKHKHHQKNHHKGPEEARNGFDDGKEHRPKAPQPFHRAHQTYHSDQPKHSADPQEGHVREQGRNEDLHRCIQH
mmetsp:Transcript_13779/g.30510  ORF Transcript_13779/g.30510 Transcript_13779/m.30510 type:complete len:207 (+) Transcript_13779:234-854(+)